MGSQERMRYRQKFEAAEQKRTTYPVLVQKSFALHEHVVLTQAAVKEVADASVVGHHQAAHSMRGWSIRRLL